MSSGNADARREKQFLELVSDPDPAKSQAVMGAMLGMRKLVVSELQAAYDSA
jgi:hypothetical protein